MRAFFERIPARLLAVLLISLALCACSKKHMESGTLVSGEAGTRTGYDGSTYSTIEGQIDGGLVIPDNNGELVVIPGAGPGLGKAGYVDARELKLKIRELAEQLVANMQDCSLQGTVALPTSFVHTDNFDASSSFGRLIAEQLYYELNQRGYPLREYRLSSSIRVKPDKGEMYLTRKLGNVATRSSVVIVGTYYNDRDAVFVNARLVRPGDGRVLRTANLVLQSNDLTKRMLRNSGGGNVAEGSMRIRDLQRALNPPRQNASGSAFDRGADIH